MHRTQIILIDSDIRRRARIAHELTNMVAFVLPLEHYSELSLAWPSDALTVFVAFWSRWLSP